MSRIHNMFRNVTLNSEGAERELNTLIEKRDIFKALMMMDNDDAEVDKAIQEYNPQTHKVMNRPNKYREQDEPYITEKLPRTRARYINEIELFFLLGKKVKWSFVKGDTKAYEVFLEYLDEMRFDSLLRQAKRLAGSETESAIVFNLTKGNGKLKVKPFVLSRTRGYKLRPLFDQYGDMIALAYEYRLREDGRNVRHCDILTKDFTHYCSYGKSGWEVMTHPNPTGKINGIFFKQRKAWDGVVPRLEREEMLDSKVADTNNYFADPIASATADVIESMTDPDKPGKLIQLGGLNSKFEYVNPPQNSDTREAEMRNLRESILFDSFTPDFSYENMKGLGTLSGAAMHNALILGYIKRDLLKENYEEMVSRMRNVIFAVLKLRYPTLNFDGLKVRFEFAEPFDTDKRDIWHSVAELYQAGVISLETAVQMLSLTEAPEEEITRLKEAQEQTGENTKN